MAAKETDGREVWVPVKETVVTEDFLLTVLEVDPQKGVRLGTQHRKGLMPWWDRIKGIVLTDRPPKS